MENLNRFKLEINKKDNNQVLNTEEKMPIGKQGYINYFCNRGVN